MKENIYIRVIKFGIEHPEGFNYDEIINDKQLKLNDWERKMVNEYLHRAYRNKQQLVNFETLFLAVETSEEYRNDSSKFIINLDSQFKYIDYLELKEARETAVKAQRFALGAILISVVSIIAMLFIIQTVKIDQQQYNEIKNLIMDKNN